MTTGLRDFMRVVVTADVAEVSRRLTASPALATMACEVGATREGASAFFLSSIAHYVYAGDTPLHLAAAAFRRQVAAVLVAHRLGGHFKTDNLSTVKTDNFRAAETREFYFGASSVRKSVCTFVRQLRGPHFSTCA